MRRPGYFSRGLGFLAATILLLGLSTQARADAALYHRLCHATGWVVVHMGHGVTAYGTCWLVDLERREAITDCHVVGSQSRVQVYFPQFRDGHPIRTTAHYLTAATPVRAQVVFRDRLRDLALLKMDRLPRGARALPLSPQTAKKGDRAYSVGTSPLLTPGRLWRYSEGRVTNAAFVVLGKKRQRWEACVVETRSRHNRGDSGTAIVNAEGEVIGVLHGVALKKEPPMSVSTDVSELKWFLAKAHRKKNDHAGPTKNSLLGTWKGSLDLDGKRLYCSTTFNDDGTFDWFGTRHMQGSYRLRDGLLKLTAPEDDLDSEGKVLWISEGKFEIRLEDQVFRFDRR
jgi:Trypsin-like peptidase domain